MPHLAGAFLQVDITTGRAFGGTVHVCIMYDAVSGKPEPVGWTMRPDWSGEAFCPALQVRVP
jgi:hypothetical protein